MFFTLNEFDELEYQIKLSGKDEPLILMMMMMMILQLESRIHCIFNQIFRTFFGYKSCGVLYNWNIVSYHRQTTKVPVFSDLFLSKLGYFKL
jgi:hypothetical protein